MVQRKTTNSSINRSASRPAGRPVTQGVQSRRSPVMASKNFAKLTPEQRAFANQLVKNQRTAKPIMGATNTANIMAKPEFLELLPIFVQKLLIADVFGSVAMNSRAQYIPFLKFIADNTKGETKAGDVFASPFVNRQGIDPNFTGRTVITDVKTTTQGLNATEGTYAAPYYPILPGSIKITEILSFPPFSFAALISSCVFSTISRCPFTIRRICSSSTILDRPSEHNKIVSSRNNATRKKSISTFSFTPTARVMIFLSG